MADNNKTLPHGLDRRDFAQTFTMLLMLFTVAPRVKASTDPAEVTAERLAVLLEAPETPPVVRDIVRQACESIGIDAMVCAHGDADCDGSCFVFQGAPENISAADIRRELPAMLRRIGHFRLNIYVDSLHLYEPEGGA